jgi:cellulose 1,4-beta-cellobiosidase
MTSKRWMHLSTLLFAAGCAAGSSLKPKALAIPTTPPAPAQNPFAGAKLYGDPEFAKMVARVPAPAPEDAARLKKLATFPVAFWLESLETAKLAGPALDELARHEAAGGGPAVPLFVVYNLPNRDCAAAGSRGELSVEKNGEALYQHQFIDVIAAAFRAHPNQKIAVVLEPDSLPNLVTNLVLPTCAAAEQIYRRGIAYAITQLSLPNVYIYMDAAHAGWLGWPKNLPKGAQLFKEVLDMAGGADRIRGFALNVSNYNPPRDPKGAKKSNPDDPSQDELGYAEDLSAAMAKLGVTGKGFLIDTSRNGKAYIRSADGNWCNVKGAGLGERPRATPAPNIDAYLWIKTPGESDGTADPKAARFDENCVSDDAMPGAPEAGELFSPYLLELVKNADPPL